MRNKAGIIAIEGIKPIFISLLFMLIFIFLNYITLALVEFIVVLLILISFRNFERFSIGRKHNDILLHVMVL